MFGSDSDIDEEFLETVLSGVSNKLTNDSAKTTRLEPSRPGSGCSSISNNSNVFTAEHRPVNAIQGRIKNLTSCRTDGENLPYHTPVKRQQLPESMCSNSNNSIERKFPGPAGILPERRNALSCPTVGSPLTVKDTIDCSTSSSTHFNLQSWHALLGKKTWQKLLADLNSQFPDKNLLDIVNIKSIKAKASARLLVGQKVPYLAAIVQEVSLSSPDPYITLCDQTGCIGGAVHRDVWKQFGEEITTGCVFLLRNVGVLSLGINPHKNQHYLNITENNLAALYSEQEDSVRITNIYLLQSNVIAKSIDDWKSDVVQISSPGKSPNQNLLLFSSPLHAGSNTVHGTLSSRSDSSFNFSPQPSQRPQLFNTPLSARNKVINEKLSNVKQFSKCGKRNNDQQSQIISSSISTNNTVNVCRSNNNVPNNQSSCVRNSSTILNLMSANKNNLCKINSNISQDIFGACSGNNNPVNISLTNTFNCNSENVSTCNNFVSSNNINNTRICKTGNSSSLNKFFSPKSPRMTNKSNTSQDLFSSDTSSDNISENSFSSICNLPKDNSVKEHPIVQKNEKILACRNYSNSCNFQHKKARFDSQDCNIVSEPNLNFERTDNYPSNNNAECFRPNSSFVDRNRINVLGQVTNEDEQWEVDTILSGLDANSFLDDDF